MCAQFLSASRLSIPLLLFTAISPAGGVERERIDRLVAPYLENEIALGFVVGVIADGQPSSFGYGRLRIVREITDAFSIPAPHTLTRDISVYATAVFTSLRGGRTR